jgi:hypothetical protein
MEAYLKNDDIAATIAKRRLKLEALQQARQAKKQRENLPKDVLDLSKACMEGTAALKQFTCSNKAKKEVLPSTASEDEDAWCDDEPWGPYLVSAKNKPPEVSVPGDLDEELQRDGELLLEDDGLGVPGLDDVDTGTSGDTQQMPVVGAGSVDSQSMSGSSQWENMEDTAEVGGSEPFNGVQSIAGGTADTMQSASVSRDDQAEMSSSSEAWAGHQAAGEGNECLYTDAGAEDVSGEYWDEQSWNTAGYYYDEYGPVQWATGDYEASAVDAGKDANAWADQYDGSEGGEWAEEALSVADQAASRLSGQEGSAEGLCSPVSDAAEPLGSAEACPSVTKESGAESDTRGAVGETEIAPDVPHGRSTSAVDTDTGAGPDAIVGWQQSNGVADANAGKASTRQVYDSGTAADATESWLTVDSSSTASTGGEATLEAGEFMDDTEHNSTHGQSVSAAAEAVSPLASDQQVFRGTGVVADTGTSSLPGVNRTSLEEGTLARPAEKQAQSAKSPGERADAVGAQAALNVGEMGREQPETGAIGDSHASDAPVSLEEFGLVAQEGTDANSVVGSADKGDEAWAKPPGDGGKAP